MIQVETNQRITSNKQQLSSQAKAMLPVPYWTVSEHETKHYIQLGL